ncbi:MAG: LytTR family transcriptional regulator DNA-binding domain-containing protein [Bacteroidia bacterium]
MTFLNSSNKKSYPIELSLTQLEGELNPNNFFRINRQYIVSRDAIEHMYMFSPTKLKVVVKSNRDLDLTVSIDRMERFKNWFK